MPESTSKIHRKVISDFGIKTEQKGLIKPGVSRAERLVNMAKHDYQLEPNVSFTPDMKWIIFRTKCSDPHRFWQWKCKRRTRQPRLR
jgi:hypothetical protein